MILEPMVGSGIRDVPAARARDQAGPARRGAAGHGILRPAGPMSQHAVVAAVGEVDDQPDDQPGAEPPPVGRRQREHQHQAAERCPGSGRAAPAGSGTAARRPGWFLRMISTAAQTIDEGEQRADVRQVRAARRSAGSRPAWPTKTPIRIVLFQGVRNLGWTSAKNSCGTRPSRAMARKTRGALSIMTSSTEVMPATPAIGDDDLGPAEADLLEGARRRRRPCRSGRTAPCRSARRPRRCRGRCR